MDDFAITEEPSSSVERLDHLIAVADQLVFRSAAIGAPPVTSEQVARRAADHMPHWMALDLDVIVGIVETAADREQRLSKLLCI